MFWYRRPLFLWPVACSSQKCWGTFVFYMGQAPILLNKPAMMVLFHLLCIKCRLFQPCRIEYSAFSLIMRSKLIIDHYGREVFVNAVRHPSKHSSYFAVSPVSKNISIWYFNQTWFRNLDWWEQFIVCHGFLTFSMIMIWPSLYLFLATKESAFDIYIQRYVLMSAVQPLKFWQWSLWPRLGPPGKLKYPWNTPSPRNKILDPRSYTYFVFYLNMHFKRHC